ncbi:hypothetical protein HK096_003593, partial [Nowakowskiella sp. JEL0078]
MADCVRVPSHLLSRLLYANPVCLLSICTLDGSGIFSRNVMTISWLTPIDNNAHFICSMKQSRNTASFLNLTHHFVLNVPVAGMEQLIYSVGSTSRVDKFSLLNIPTCEVGWHPSEATSTSPFTSHSPSEPNLEIALPLDDLSLSPNPQNLSSTQVPVPDSTFICDLAQDPTSMPQSRTPTTQTDILPKRRRRRQKQIPTHHPPLVAISDCVAHIVCRVDEKLSRHGHWVLFCTIEDAFVKNDYWDGRNFAARNNSPILATTSGNGPDTTGLQVAAVQVVPNYLSFLGSGRFAEIRSGVSCYTP